MAIELNHTIVPAHDPVTSAQFLAHVLGLQVGQPVAHFTPAFCRIRDAGITYYADPACRLAGQVYTSKNGNRGTYFRDPNGHLMEILTTAATGEPA
jgi:hypothetical protein